MTKHRGGRGRHAPNKHESFSVSLPPHLKALLDSWVTDDLSRSEVVASLIQAHAALLATAEAGQESSPQAPVSVRKPRAKIPEGENTREGSAKSLPITTVRVDGGNGVRTTPLIPVVPLQEGHTPRASMRAGGVKRTATQRLAQSVPVLNVMRRAVPRGLGWKPERYAQIEKLLEQGDSLQADGVNYRTAKGGIMGYKTAEALVRLGVLVPA